MIYPVSKYKNGHVCFVCLGPQFFYSLKFEYEVWYEVFITRHRASI